MKEFLLRFLLFITLATSSFGSGLIVVHDETFWLPPGHPRIHPPPIRRPPPVAHPLEVVSHQVNIRIRDQVATTTSEQEFYNPNNQRLEGTFLFPVPKGAHLNKFEMTINGQPASAELLSADKARSIYENIVRQLKDPGLLEYAGRDLFKVRIFPIEPHEKKKVTLSYTHVLKSDEGLVHYVFPLRADKFSAKPLKNVSVKVDLQTKQPLKAIYSPSHSVEIRRSGNSEARIGYEASELRPESDFQFFYSQDKQAIDFNLLTYKPADEDGFFLLLAAPGADAKTKEIVAKDVVFVIDTSGSMSGKKIEQARKALQFCVENLNPSDRFEIIRFSTDVEPLFDKLAEASPTHLARATEFVRELKSIGGTAIDDALRKALQVATTSESRPSVVVFLTDGRPTLGNTDESQIVDAAIKGAGNRVRVFCFGIGTDVNTHLLDRITEGTRAFSQYVLPEEDLEVKLSSFFSKIKEPVLTELKIRFPENIRATRLLPSPLPDLFRGEQLLLVGRYQGTGKGSIQIEGKLNQQTPKFSYEGQFSDQATEHDFIPRLWATRRIGYLLDEIRLHGEKSELKDEVSQLAKKYGVVTPYTAYLIVEDEKKRVQTGGSDFHLFNKDVRMENEARELSRNFYQDHSGDAAVGGARSSYSLKSATVAEDGIRLGSKEALRFSPATPSPSGEMQRRYGLSNRGIAFEETETRARIDDYAARGRYVNGRTFFKKDDQWIDSLVASGIKTKTVRIEFASPEYFDLLKAHPEVASWVALGHQVQFVLGGVTYEIYQKSE